MERRTFLKLLAGALNTAVAAVVAAPAIRFLAHPLARRRADAAYRRAAPMGAVPADRPVRVTLLADQWDAYVHHPLGPVGTVWLLPAKDEAGLRCLQTICPHLGCGIEYAADRNAFYCPCHASEFAPDGRRRFGPSPREMDELPCRVTDPDENGVRWVEVQYAAFQPGLAEKRPAT